MGTISNKSGFSLIEAVVMVGIMGVTMGSSLSLLKTVMDTNQVLDAKIEKASLTQEINEVLKSGELCNCSFSGKTFSADNLESQEVETNSLYHKCPPAPQELITTGSSFSTTSYTIDRIYIDNIVNKSDADSFSGKLTIFIGNNENKKTALKPVSVPVSFLTDPDSPSGKKQIVSCQTGGETQVFTDISRGTFNGAGGLESGSSNNIKRVQRLNTGDYYVYFKEPYPNKKYTPVATPITAGRFVAVSSKGTGGFRIHTRRMTGGGSVKDANTSVSFIVIPGPDSL